MDTLMPIEFALDDDGLFRMQCPFCNQQFKLFAEDLNKVEYKLYCPYCGLWNTQEEYLTEDQKQKIQDLLENYMTDMINKTLTNMGKKINSSHMKFKSKPLEKKDPRILVESNDFEELIFQNSSVNVFVFSPETLNILYDPLTGDLCHRKID